MCGSILQKILQPHKSVLKFSTRFSILTFTFKHKLHTTRSILSRRIIKDLLHKAVWYYHLHTASISVARKESSITTFITFFLSFSHSFALPHCWECRYQKAKISVNSFLLTRFYFHIQHVLFLHAPSLFNCLVIPHHISH